VDLLGETSGDRPVDALTFCVQVLRAFERGVLTHPGATTPVGPVPRGHLTLARPATCVYHQEGRAGALPVVNKVNPAYAGNIARWATIPALREPVTAQVTALTARRHPGCVQYQFSAGADWTTTQRPAVRDWPLITWGPDRAVGPHGHETTVPLSAFQVRRDRPSGTLQVLDPDGRPAALCYAGAVPPYLLGGVAGILAMITDPWISRLPVPPGDGATASRLVLDGVVLRRRGWTFAPEHMPQVDGADPARALLEVERWRRRHGLPDEVFVAATRPDAPFGRPDKPTWLSAQHPITALAALRGPATRWDVTEALPTSGDSPRAIEYCSVIEHG
jgi:hypothetical protein